MEFDYLFIFISEKVVITGPLGLFTVSRILEINKSILLSFKFEKNFVLENSTNVNKIVQITEEEQCAHEYPNKLLQKEEIEELSF